MKTKCLFYVVCFLICIPHNVSSQSENIGTDSDICMIPVGMDAYRMWNRWPLQRLGIRSYMRSTYDRRGHNEGADASHFLFVNDENYNVTLDVLGRGMLYFFRTNHWHGSPWHFIVDGTDNIVGETGTYDPVNAKQNISKSAFVPLKPFPEPLNQTWAVTKGADLIWSPIGFEESLRIAYSRTRYGTGYYIYHLFADENRISQPVQTWDTTHVPDNDVLDLIGRSGTDIAPQGIWKAGGRLTLDRERILVKEIKKGPSAIRALKLTIPLSREKDLERMRLQITWDGMKHPSVDAPVSLFFGAGTLFNREKKEYLVRAFPVNIRYDYSSGKIEMACYFPMPFFKSARIELTDICPDDTEIAYEIRYEPWKVPVGCSSYFHATYKDIPVPEPGKDMVFLDTRGMEGFEEWSGSFIGNSFIFSHNGVLNTLEGDPRFFFDESQTPSYGTGTEEWGGGGDYWGGENMTLPFAGHPCGIGKDKSKLTSDRDLIESAYRFLLADLMPFGRRAVIKFEHGGENLSVQHYEAVTYWYGLPAASLVLTDVLDVGNEKDEKDHDYVSPSGSVVETITSRYEWGIDHFPSNIVRPVPGYDDLRDKEVYPAHTEDGRFTKGETEFTVSLDPDNRGALLRRTLDYSFPNQKAEVYVSGTTSDSWEYAGIWYTAGGNVYIYSNPKGELDPRQINIEISNRRFRDDEFLIPERLTGNRSALRIRIKFIPDNQELYPRMPYPKESAWSELKYEVYSYVTPQFTP